MNIKKQLRNDANKVLPDERMKNTIKAQLGLPSNNDVVQNNGTVAKTYPNQKLRNSLIAIVIIFTLCVAVVCGTLFYVGGKQLPISDSLINLDLCASVQILADKEDKVSTVEPLDKDGVLLMYGMPSLTGKTVTEVCDTLVAESQKLGFLTGTEIVEVVAVNDNYDKELSVNETLKVQLESKGLTVNTPQSNISKLKANLKKITPNKLALLEVAAKTSGQSLSDISVYDISQINKLAKNYNQSVIDKTTSRIETALGDDVLKELKERVKELEKCLDDIDDLEDNISDNENKAQFYIDQFNSKYPQYAFTQEYNEEAFELHFDKIADTLEDELDSLEDDYESHFDTIKKQLKLDFDNDDDEEDEDDDDD